MKPKPNDARFRNLYAYRDSIWYERMIGDKRHRFDLETTSWHEASDRRDAWEGKKGLPPIRCRVPASERVPTFAEMAARYLKDDTAHLASSTIVDRKSHLAATGSVIRHLGARRLDEIDAGTLRERWWNPEIQNTARTNATGMRYLASIAGVFNYALSLKLITESPVDALRRQLSRQARTKKGRAAEQSYANPIDSPEALNRLVSEARNEGLAALAFTLCLLDAGLRAGEVAALRWRSIAWGSEDDPRRHVHITRTRSRDSDTDEAPKSGRSRRVQLSRRLRAALVELFKSQKPSSLDQRIFEDMDGNDYREGPWGRIIARADLPGRLPKDLRDTFGSWLVSCGVPLLYVSRQLGHSTIAVTEKHYAKWIPGGGDLYVQPPALEVGEVPADLLTRLPKSPQSPHIGDLYALPDSLKSSDLQ